MIGRVTIHHQGAGVPSNFTQPEYTYWIGTDRWIRIQPASTSYATYGYNHVSTDICLSGNRMTIPVTDNDIALIRSAILDSRKQDGLIVNPVVEPHKALYNTVCPGDLTIARWGDILSVCIDMPQSSLDHEGVQLTTAISPNGGWATPVPALHGILLEGGARLVGDAPIAGGTDHFWRSKDPLVINSGEQLKDSPPTPKQDGVMALFVVGPNDTRSYFVPWA